MAGVRVDEKLSDSACRFETFLELLERRIRNPVIAWITSTPVSFPDGGRVMYTFACCAGLLGMGNAQFMQIAKKLLLVDGGNKY